MCACCNRFTAAQGEAEKADIINAYHELGLDKAVGPLLMDDSDGDVRRRGPQIVKAYAVQKDPDKSQSRYKGVDHLSQPIACDLKDGKVSGMVNQDHKQ